MEQKRRLLRHILEEIRSSGIRVAPSDGFSAIQEFVSLRTTAFPQFWNSCRSGRRRFRSSEIRVVADIEENITELISSSEPDR